MRHFVLPVPSRMFKSLFLFVFLKHPRDIKIFLFEVNYLSFKCGAI